MLRPPRACQPGLGPSRLALGTPLRQWPPAAPDVPDDVSRTPAVADGYACPPFYYYRDVRYPSRHFVFVASLRGPRAPTRPLAPRRAVGRVSVEDA